MKNILLTGASSSMGLPTLKMLIQEDVFIRAFSLKSDSKKFKSYSMYKNFELFIGDVRNYSDIYHSLLNIDIILHVAALVSPQADENPKLAMEINYGGLKNIINALIEQKRENEVKLVFISSVSVYGDRMPPIHWGQVGDPVKPSVFDYYSVAKIAAERLLIESNIKNWVILRQTGMISNKMFKVWDSIIFHQPLDNVLEYISAEDSARLLVGCCKELDSTFWQHIYNIGGSKSLRLPFYKLFSQVFAQFGINSLDKLTETSWFALRNFHGHYYIDSDRLNDFINYKQDGIKYVKQCSEENMHGFLKIIKALMNVDIINKVAVACLKQSMKVLGNTKRGTLRMQKNKNDDMFKAFFISNEAFEAIPKWNKFEHFSDWDRIVKINHGYNKNKDANALNINDIKKAAEFRGGKCLGNDMQIGNWSQKIEFECAFGHKFSASPRLILEAGHWCDVCENNSWNYHEIAKVNPFFAQVWYPLHSKDEEIRCVEKTVKPN